MSSNDSAMHPDYDPNLRIKNEPDAISEPSASAPPIIPNLIRTIKAEPGLSQASTAIITTTTRLPSFRVPRDLTLGGGGQVKIERPKKVYIPNLNAQRIKNREYVKIIMNLNKKEEKYSLFNAFLNF